jgi:hypothetical protein
MATTWPWNGRNASRLAAVISSSSTGWPISDLSGMAASLDSAAILKL